MRRGLRRAWLALALAGCTAPPGGTDEGDDSDAADSDAPAPGVRMLVVDNGLNQLALVDTRGGPEWTVPIPGGGRDLAVVGDEVLVSVDDGAVRLALADGAVTWSVDTFSGVQSAEPLDGGGARLAAQVGDDVVITEVDSDGATVGEPLVLAGYDDLRLARRLADGHTLFTAGGPYRAVEVDGAGAEVWSAALPGKGYLATREPDGTTLAATGEDVRIVRLHPDGAVDEAWWGGREAHGEDVFLAWFSGFHRYDDDHVAVANWHGHGTWGQGPAVVVFDDANALVWQWQDDVRVKQATNVVVLDAVLP